MQKKIYLALGLLLASSSAFSKSKPDQEKAQNDAENFGRTQSQRLLDAIKQFNPDPFISNHERNKPFSAEEARASTLNASGGSAVNPKSPQKIPQLNLNLPKEAYSNQTDLNGFEVELEGLVKEPSSSGSEMLTSIVTKLSVFKEIKHELEASRGADVRQVSIFKGDCHKCSRSVLKNVLYDCCAEMDGLATKAHLAKCSSEEKALSAIRQEGRCHYVGEYKKKKLGIQTEERKVFCCFSSKLACILQEQARVQLHRGWGKAKKPDCGGLTTAEIKGLDFTKLDLNKAIPPQMNTKGDFESKLSSFQKKMQDTHVDSSGD